MQTKMKKITNQERIEILIKSMANDKSKVSLWQEKKGAKRKSYLCRILRFDLKREEIFFTSNQDLFDFDLNEEVYLFWEKEHIIFKVDISFMSDYKIAIKLPVTIMTKEKRLLERVNCTDDMQTSISYNFGVKLDSSFHRFSYSSEIFDYSEKGLALKVSQPNISKFLEGDRLTMKVPLLGNEILLGRIAHISNSSHGVYRVGLSFE